MTALFAVDAAQKNINYKNYITYHYSTVSSGKVKLKSGPRRTFLLLVYLSLNHWKMAGGIIGKIL